jgi:hypothetical protein
VKGGCRPSTKPKDGGAALYVEKDDAPAQSLLREDDIEVYIRQVSHRNKCGRLMQKYSSRLKWLALHKKHAIFEKAVEGSFKVKQANIDRQLRNVEKVRERALKQNPKMDAE